MSFTFAKRILPLTCLQLILLGSTAQAAQKIFVNVSSFEASIKVETLKQFGETGEAKGLLRKILKRLDPAKRQMTQAAFATRIEVNPVSLSEFLYTPQGSAVLAELGDILQSESGLSGAKGLRSALFHAAQDSECGLTIANTLKHFPGDRIRLNAARIGNLITAFQKLSGTSPLPESPVPPDPMIGTGDFSLSHRLHLENRGEYDWTFIGAGLQSSVGDVAELYVPQSLRRARNSIDIGQRPVIVISHGMGGDRGSFRYLAKHLASHGFIIIVPEHVLLASGGILPGGVRGEATTPPPVPIDALLEQDWAQKVSPEDFIQRPLAVSRLLDALEQQDNPLLSQRVDWTRVGVLGQSFGGYSTLALGGAQIDLEALAQHCPVDATTWNPSLVLQCIALGLAVDQTQYRDPRVKAIAAFNPLGGAIFGPKGMAKIKVPTLILAGSDDVVTPPRDEQIPPFQWLTHQHRYLLWLAGGTHFSVIQDSVSQYSATQSPEISQTSAPNKVHAERVELREQIKSLASLSKNLIGEHHDQAKAYAKIASLAFFQTHLAGDPSYARFLTPEFAAWLSDGKALPLSLSQELE